MNLEATFPRSRLSTALGSSDLAHRPSFRMGPLVVEPARRRAAVAGGEALTIQPLAMRVLLALADARDETCSRDDLVQACWNQRIVGDDAVHRIISNLRRDLARLSAGAVRIETISKVGYRLRVDGDERVANGAVVETSAKSRRLNRGWPVATLLLAGIVSAGFFATTRATADVTEIAVVSDTSAANADTARFADGLTGDLARLAGTMPSVAFVEPSGKESHHSLLLRVALDRESATPTAWVRLVDEKAGAVVWSREFVAEGGTMAELRELVANGVTGVVQCGLDRSVKFDDPVGLRLFLGACDGLETQDFERARTFAQQITQFRPDLPAGWACLANTTIFVAAKAGRVDDAVLARAEHYARRALAADPTSGLAYVALAMASTWRGEPSLVILERGLQVDPDFSMLHRHYALALSGAGMVSKAVEPALRAVALQPHHPGNYQIAVAALLNAGRTQEALALSDRMQRRWRYDRGVGLQRLQTLVLVPNATAALAAFSASPRHNEPEAAIIREALTWRTGPANYDWASFDRVAQQVYAESADMAWEISRAAAEMGDRPRALEWLQRAPSESFLAWSPMFAPEAAELRRDPKFFDKMASVGMVARWRKSGRWPDFCSDPRLPYDCRARADEMARRAAI